MIVSDLNGTIYGYNQVFTMSGPLPDLPSWKVSGAFQDFRYIYIKGAHFGPYIPAWLLDYWYVGWDTPPTLSQTWKIWLACASFHTFLCINFGVFNTVALLFTD